MGCGPYRMGDCTGWGSGVTAPFIVTREAVDAWLEATEAHYDAILAHLAGGPIPDGRSYISGMEANDARNWQGYDMRKKLTSALMNLRPRDIRSNVDRCKWMDSAIPAMVEAMMEMEAAPC